MEERVEISMLLDIYGELLTEKQRNIMNLYYNEDLSLAEISEINDTSRQAIHDTIRRCYKLLISYESKLKILDKSFRVEQNKKVVLERIEDIQKSNENLDSIVQDLENLKSILKENIFI